MTGLLLTVLSFTLVGCQSGQKAEAPAPTPAPPSNAYISFACDVAQGFNFEKNAEAMVGYIEYLTIDGSRLKADFSVVNPISEDEDKVVGVLSDISWGGGYGDPVYFSCQVSKANQAILARLANQALDNSGVEFSFAVYDYDPRSKEYFKAFHSNSANLQGLVNKRGGDLDLNIESGPSGEVSSPKNFNFQLGVMPQDTVMDIYLGFSSKDKLVKQWGVQVGV